MKDDPKYQVAVWLDSCQTRFKNMFVAELDKNGWPALRKALQNFEDRGSFTVGEIQYLFNRTHPRGSLPDYNLHKNLHKRHGLMLPCPLQALIDSNLVNWRSGSNGVIQPALAAAIKKETRWEWKLGNLRPQHMTAFEDLFS